MKRIALLLTLLFVTSAAGCLTAQDRDIIDHRAAVMNALADKINACPPESLATNALDVAWIIENERRAAVNLSNWAHWQKPKYPSPASRPTALPWTPLEAP